MKVLEDFMMEELASKQEEIDSKWSILNTHVCVYLYVCMYVCMYVLPPNAKELICSCRTFAPAVCMYVFMYACMCVCTYVCMYVCIATKQAGINLKWSNPDKCVCMSG